jgi:hypothetical protein
VPIPQIRLTITASISTALKIITGLIMPPVVARTSPSTRLRARIAGA